MEDSGMNWDCVYCGHPFILTKRDDYTLLHCKFCSRTVGIRKPAARLPIRGQLDIDGREAA
jgi:hypothetical protein